MRRFNINTINGSEKGLAELVFVDNGEFVNLTLKHGDQTLSAEDIYPFFGLVKLRSELEKSNTFLQCNGCRMDVYPSGASAIGVMAYLLVMNQQATELLNIFDPVIDAKLVGTVTKQKEYWERWLKSL